MVSLGKKTGQKSCLESKNVEMKHYYLWRLFENCTCPDAETKKNVYIYNSYKYNYYIQNNNLILDLKNEQNYEQESNIQRALLLLLCDNVRF